MKYQVLLSLLLISTLLTACGGQSGGLAPSREVVEPATTSDVSNKSTLKFGETINSTTGWEVSIDTTDPVQESFLANGWNVEVKYE